MLLRNVTVPLHWKTVSIACESSVYSSSCGCSIHRRHYPCAGDVEQIASAVFVHGLGDHCGRHEHTLSRFVNRGIACTTFDLPGHGKSDHPRGYIDSIDDVHTLICETSEYADRRSNRSTPIGLLGHSMGAFLSLDFLSSHPNTYDFSWLSSPLIDAGWNKSRWLHYGAHILGVAAPRFSIHSGVSSSACKRDPERIRETERDDLVHRRLSMRLGKILLTRSKLLKARAAQINPKLQLLVTHGSEDVICPSNLSRELFNQLPLRRKQYVHLEGMLHEPFNDIGSETFFAALESWLDQLTETWRKSSDLAA